MEIEDIEVVTYFLQDGPEGPGWYAWEAEYEDEGYFWMGTEKPTDADMKEVCPEYVLKN